MVRSRAHGSKFLVRNKQCCKNIIHNKGLNAMAYKVVVRVSGRWQEVGLQHLTVESAKQAGRSEWARFTWLVVPA